MAQLPKFPSEKFYDFSSGVKIDDETINEWINECHSILQKYPKMDSTFIGSGNTKIILFKYEEDGETWYDVLVAQGYYETTVKIQ